MPRKPTKEKKTVTVLVHGNPVSVILHPPTKTRKSWYAYWAGLISSRSTGQVDFVEAVKVGEGMLRKVVREHLKKTKGVASFADDVMPHIAKQMYEAARPGTRWEPKVPLNPAASIAK